MGNTWRKAMGTLVTNLCVPKGKDDGDEAVGSSRSRLSDSGRRAPDVASVAAPAAASRVKSEDSDVLMPTLTTGEPKNKCRLCCAAMEAGDGSALFTAECSHTFHYHCIASNARDGNYMCPVCWAGWKEIPQNGFPKLPHARTAVVDLVDLPDEYHQFTSYLHPSEPRTFNDDEPVELPPETILGPQPRRAKMLEIQIYPEFSAIPQSDSVDNFNVLIHLKALQSSMDHPNPGRYLSASSTVPQHSRAPVDLVTLLDVSASMSGMKLALLKRAMGFVIQNLGPSDRLSVVAFSSTARRLFHLRRMSDHGKERAIYAVNSLSSSGGTDIVGGLLKVARVIEESRQKNPFCGIILLSDGQDVCHPRSYVNESRRSPPDYKSLVPSIFGGGATGHRIPVHTFGFGADHDSNCMHTIAQLSGGTYSFIESEVDVQDAFAQCIGGLLSVVVQHTQVSVESACPGVQIASIESGSYVNEVTDSGRSGLINVGDMYSAEERNFLISMTVPSTCSKDVVLLNVGCVYVDPVTKQTVTSGDEEARIQRPDFVGSQTPSIEVDRERNRIEVAQAMSDAKAAADRGALSEAVSILEARRLMLSKSPAALSGDQLCSSLDAELKEMQERMASRQAYEASGRAYVLSGLSSHLWQRATTRGDSTHGGVVVHAAYQTPSMVDMVRHSQQLCSSTQDSRTVIPSIAGYFSTPLLPR